MAKSKATATKASAKKTTTKSTAKAKTAKSKAPAKTKAKTAAGKKSTSPQELEMLNETGRRKQAAPAPKVERRKRRRQIDPTTCEREYSDPEIQFMHAMDEYKRASGRMFPTCSEILEVIARLGYRQIENPLELMYEPKSEKKKDEDWDAEDDLDNEDLE